MAIPAPASSIGDPRAIAQEARRQRGERIARLRRQVLAAAVATFALAFALVAFDGSMGTSTKAAAGSGAAATSSSQPATSASGQFDDSSTLDGSSGFDDSGTVGAGQGSFDDGGGATTGSSADPVTTSQS